MKSWLTSIMDIFTLDDVHAMCKNELSLEPGSNDPAAVSIATRLPVVVGSIKAKAGAHPEGATGQSEGRFFIEPIFRDAWPRSFALAQGRAII